MPAIEKNTTGLSRLCIVPRCCVASLQMARYARTPPSLSRYCGRNPPYCLSNGRKPGAPPGVCILFFSRTSARYCSLAGAPGTILFFSRTRYQILFFSRTRYQILFFSRTSTRYHLSLVTGYIQYCPAWILRLCRYRI